MKKAKEMQRRIKLAEARTEFVNPLGKRTSKVKQKYCNHQWSEDGQTMTAVRYTCSKCGLSELR